MRRAAWAVAALVLAAFLGFEALTYGGWAWATGALGLIGPDLAFLAAIGSDPRESGQGRLAPRAVPAYNLLHRWQVALAVTVAVCFLPISHAAFVPWFVLGLGWLLHIAVDRLAGYGLRDADGWIRGRRHVAVADRG
ncbi:DUF4260 family protein [Luteipulveratus flavus]|uniref:DUF4260 family protein n=1 Tax=Luteipulveratus flavus TaxID=3031728 RepID=A0ABT6C936_9MICO|nr:DUF4260 family protein [Luteipulveratus sp. YIM 133296]MDF8264807.1 DUF4260 family protein [Luteipulveratus sp. YIM 133296]